MKKRKGIVKDRKKTIALLCVCVCVCVWSLIHRKSSRYEWSGYRKITDQYKQNENGITYLLD